MDISEVLQPGLMLFDLKAKDKREAIEELAGPMLEEGYLTDGDAYVRAVMERETVYSTGIGMGVGIPHGKSAAVTQPVVAFGRSKQGVEFQAMDGKPVYLAFLIAVPENSDNEHLNILSMLSRSLMHEEVRNALLNAATPGEVLDAFGNI